jgi:LacI family transcriptional regulator
MEFQSSGILVIGTNLSEEESEMIHDAYPTSVIIDTCYPHIPGNFVVMNNLLGGAQAAKYLISCGHRSMGYVESKVRISNFDERKKAFIKELERNGLSLSKSNVFQVSPIMEKAQNDFFSYLERGDRLPTALFCESDNIAIGVLKALQRFGLSVPQDISIVGFDDIPHCTIVSPPLTSVRVQKDVMGAEAIRKLIQLVELSRSRVEMNKPSEPMASNDIKIIIDTSISERESVKRLV